MIELRCKDHEHNINMLKEFYHSNKYILVEQMKDAFIDAINCMEYLEQMNGEADGKP